MTAPEIVRRSPTLTQVTPIDPGSVPVRVPVGVPVDVRPEATQHALRLLAGGEGHIVLVGPAGYGKTTALRRLELAARESGRSVRRQVAGRDRAPQTDPALLARRHPEVVIVDDAHLLPGEGLRELTDLARAGVRVLAAVTPPPEGSAPSDLSRLLESAAVVSLEPWLLDDVEALLNAGPAEVPDTLDAETALQLTGGLPWLVVKLLADPGSAGCLPSPGQPTGPERSVLRVVNRLPPPLGEVLMALCAGYPVEVGSWPAPLRGLDARQARLLLDRLYDAGLLTRDGRVPPMVRRAVLLHLPRHRLRPYLSDSLIDDLVDAGVALEPVAADLAAAGLRDPRLAVALEARAEERIVTHPAEAASLLTAAAQCGSDDPRLTLRRAEAMAMAGRLADASDALECLPADLPSSAADGLRVAATVAVLSGRLHDAAELSRWSVGQDGLLQTARANEVAAFVLYGSGDREEADALVEQHQRERPALSASPIHVMATAVNRSLGSDPSAALSMLVRSGRGAPPRRELLPDQPAALGALVALHGGDLALAESLLAGAMSRGRELLPHDRARVVALRAWTSMQAGQYAQAHDLLAGLRGDPVGYPVGDLVGDRSVGEPVSPRDEPWVWGLRVGLARRQDDARALARLWVDARGFLVGHPVDLYSLLPLGEIGLAAARLGEGDLVEPLWARAIQLLERLGAPPLWGPAFHWYGVQAAILTDRPEAMAPHAAALVAAARTSPFAAALARAGRTWVTALGHQVDPDEVQAAARGLAAVGQRWEGARLAGHAAARAADRRDAAHLLECARDLLAATTSPDPGPAPPTADERRAGAVPLSRREREVVELVLAGMTYRQIGETLYLSAKTVEHHIARVKRRTGVTSRSDLLERLSLSLH